MLVPGIQHIQNPLESKKAVQMKQVSNLCYTTQVTNIIFVVYYINKLNKQKKIPYLI